MLDVITYSYWDSNSTMLIKGTRDIVCCIMHARPLYSVVEKCNPLHTLVYHMQFAWGFGCALY